MTLYLNNSGHRWIEVDARGRRNMPFVLVLPDGRRIGRKADWYESFGNFAVIAYRYRGKRFRGMPKSETGCETRLEGESLLQHVFHSA